MSARRFDLRSVLGSRGSRAGMGLFLGAFVVGSLAACGVEYLRAQQAGIYAATASVVIAASEGSSGSAPWCDRPQVDAESIKRRLASSGNAGRSTDAPPGSSARPDAADNRATSATDRQSLQSAMHVEVASRPNGCTCIKITARAKSARAAIEQADAAAEWYASELRADRADALLRWLGSFPESYQKLREELGQIVPQLEAVLGGLVSPAGPWPTPPSQGVPEQVGSVPTLAQEQLTPVLPEPPAGSDPRGPENPEWTAARRKLEELHRRRSQLLLDRTTAHPEVRFIEQQIAEAEQRLARIAERLARDASATFPAKPQSHPTETQAPKPRVEYSRNHGHVNAMRLPSWFQALHELCDRLGRLARAPGAEVGLDTQAVRRMVLGQGIWVERAEKAELIPAQIGGQGWALTAMTAGMILMAAVGMIWTGAGIDCPWTHPSQVERALGLPVLGTIAITGHSAGPACLATNRLYWKWTCMFGGVAVLAGYVLLLVRPMWAL